MSSLRTLRVTHTNDVALHEEVPWRNVYEQANGYVWNTLVRRRIWNTGHFGLDQCLACSRLLEFTIWLTRVWVRTVDRSEYYHRSSRCNPPYLYPKSLLQWQASDILRLWPIKINVPYRKFLGQNNRKGKWISFLVWKNEHLWIYTWYEIKMQFETTRIHI